MDITKTICFTGHRPQKLGGFDEDNPLNIHIKKILYPYIKLAYLKGYRYFISGMALGVDQWAAEIIIELREEYPGMQLILAIPFEGQESRWPAQSQIRWNSIKNQADECIIVCDGNYQAWKLHKRNEWMIDHSSTVIAVWDGSKSGTGNCVKYAKENNKNVWKINPALLKNK